MFDNDSIDRILNDSIEIDLDELAKEMDENVIRILDDLKNNPIEIDLDELAKEMDEITHDFLE